MSLLQSLPSSFCQAGPEEIEGIGNTTSKLFSCQSQSPIITSFFPRPPWTDTQKMMSKIQTTDQYSKVKSTSSETILGNYERPARILSQIIKSGITTFPRIFHAPNRRTLASGSLVATKENIPRTQVSTPIFTMPWLKKELWR